MDALVIDRCSKVISGGLDRAIDLVHDLALDGCTVLSVEVSIGAPRITVEPPRAELRLTGGRLAGAILRVEHGPEGHRRRLYGLTVRGCRVEWDAATSQEIGDGG
jgi:hypothetical protein